jgi:hypothetical protein
MSNQESPRPLTDCTPTEVTRYLLTADEYGALDDDTDAAFALAFEYATEVAGPLENADDVPPAFAAALAIAFLDLVA